LALVRRIAQLHGGDVRIEDREGGGARFVLSFVSPGMG
jgi:signal transduction histidine kinase